MYMSLEIYLDLLPRGEVFIHQSLRLLNFMDRALSQVGCWLKNTLCLEHGWMIYSYPGLEDIVGNLPVWCHNNITFFPWLKSWLELKNFQSSRNFKMKLKFCTSFLITLPAHPIFLSQVEVLHECFPRWLSDLNQNLHLGSASRKSNTCCTFQSSQLPIVLYIIIVH